MKQDRTSLSNHSANCKARSVVVLMEDAGSFACELLAGIARYQREAPRPWTLHIVRRRRFELPPPFLQSWRGHGIIARVDSPEVESCLRQTGLPVVNVSGALKQPYFRTFVQDAQPAAQLALQCFHERGFRHLAFVGDSLRQWSLERAGHFEGLLKECGSPCAKLLLHPAAFDTNRASSIIQSWLRSQPRPLGIWAGDDTMGLQVLNACLREGIAVPEEVAVLGVDNDASLAELSSPPLSSVMLDGEAAGYLAAKALGHSMSGEPQALGIVTSIKPRGIVFRGSTDICGISDPLIALTLKIIQQEACNGLHVAELVRRVPLARRRLEIRFKRILNRTLLAEIRRVQCIHARKLLEVTNLPVTEVAERCGYKHLEHFSKVFKKVVGVTPGHHRRVKSQPTFSS